jgi:hypothetical protein
LESLRYPSLYRKNNRLPVPGIFSVTGGMNNWAGSQTGREYPEVEICRRFP